MISNLSSLHWQLKAKPSSLSRSRKTTLKAISSYSCERLFYHRALFNLLKIKRDTRAQFKKPFFPSPQSVISKEGNAYVNDLSAVRAAFQQIQFALRSSCRNQKHPLERALRSPLKSRLFLQKNMNEAYALHHRNQRGLSTPSSRW